VLFNIFLSLYSFPFLVYIIKQILIIHINPNKQYDDYYSNIYYYILNEIAGYLQKKFNEPIKIIFSFLSEFI